ncbi:LPS export ABC transporter periplasmic protein LptC [Idiomarina seosinensis]|uniref:Lipopolysaccharide export system protein LptC n=1 Tax=Idiomarina seosinensis TaxID=281739 RepID=A0A432ZD73_9GAMM|nr:LPS export ABC transporter periplasmic protein LptC [Idiomarina seosinensis]RUO75917.1 LPS export ABC transporter periplasmic protein LptC [Idiomarina seosinensis]
MNWRIGFILLVLFSAGILLVWRPFTDTNETADNRRSQIMKPDFTAQGLQTRLFESEGDLAHQLNAEQMAHYLQIGLTELTKPVYSVFTNKDEATWKISAEQGTFYDDQTLILERNVEIVSLQPDTSIERVLTDYLIIDMAAETMRTDYPVTMFGPQLTVQGDGMKADLYAEKMELNRHVKTVFDPR